MGRSPSKWTSPRNVLYQGLHCLCRRGQEFKVDRAIAPQTGNPLVVFSSEYATSEKLELVMKMKVGVEGFEVKDTNGKPWLRVERKGMARWNERIISNMEGIPVCSIERDPKSGRFKIWSHVDHKPRPVAEIRERRSFKTNTSKDRKEEIRVILQGDELEARPFLQVNGQLHRRLFGISWTDDHGSNDNLVAMSWGAISKSQTSPNNEKEWYVMEIPAGVDAAFMVALAIVVDERDFSKGPPPRMALPSHSSHPVVGFGERYVTKLGTIVALSMEHDRIQVTDGIGQRVLCCGSDGIFSNPEGKPVFELTEGGFCMQGISESNSMVGMTFSKSAGDGSAVKLSMMFSSGSPREKNQELMAIIEPDVKTIPLYAVQDDGILGSPIAQAVLGNQSPDDFEQWFYGSLERLLVVQNVDADPFVHVGIGAEVAAGVDVALVIAAMLLIVKFLPAAMSSKPMLGVIHPSGVVRWDGLQWVLEKKPISGLLSQCGLNHFGRQVKLVD